MAELESMVRLTTQITLTPDGEEHGFPEGTVWLYSQGMWTNHGIPDLEMRGVPTSFQNAAGNVMNEMNAYRLFHKDNKPFLPGQTVSWSTGNFNHPQRRSMGWNVHLDSRPNVASVAT